MRVLLAAYRAPEDDLAGNLRLLCRTTPFSLDAGQLPDPDTDLGV